MYVDDFVDSMLLAMEKVNCYNPINIGYGKGFSIKELLKIMLEIDGYTNAKVVFNSSKPSMIPIRLVDTTKAETVLGFKPKTELKEGIKKTIKWYRENKKKDNKMTSEVLQNKDVDVLLIYPKTGIDIGATVAPPHALLTIAAPLHNKGYKVKIIDQRVEHNWKAHLVASLQKKPICIGISSMTGIQIYFAIEIAKIIRKITDGKIPIIWGGALSF